MGISAKVRREFPLKELGRKAPPSTDEYFIRIPNTSVLGK
jgi:hypothetical protein